MQMSFHLSIKYKKILKQFSPFITITAQPACSVTGTRRQIPSHFIANLSKVLQLEGTFKDHQVQLFDFFKAKKMLKRITNGYIQMPLEH